jgi:hypothetical protein
MNIRNLAMIGAASLLLMPVPSFASSSSERETTRQLNMQATQDAQASNARAIPVKDAAANAPDNMAPAAAPAGTVQIAAAEPAATIAPQTLSEVTNPPSKIATATVLDNSGQIIGAVQKVEVSASGSPTRVSVALTGKAEKMVTWDASSLRYDAAKNEITTPDSAAQIRARPSGG